LLRPFLFGPSDAPIQISMTVFCLADGFFKSYGRFWLHPCNNMRHSCVSCFPVLFCLY